MQRQQGGKVDQENRSQDSAGDRNLIGNLLHRAVLNCERVGSNKRRNRRTARLLKLARLPVGIAKRLNRLMNANNANNLDRPQSVGWAAFILRSMRKPSFNLKVNVLKALGFTYGWQAEKLQDGTLQPRLACRIHRLSANGTS